MKWRLNHVLPPDAILLLAKSLHRGTHLLRFKYTASNQRRTKYMSQGLQATWIHGIHTRTQTHTNTHAYIRTGAGTHTCNSGRHINEYQPEIK